MHRFAKEAKERSLSSRRTLRVKQLTMSIVSKGSRPSIPDEHATHSSTNLKKVQTSLPMQTCCGKLKLARISRVCASALDSLRVKAALVETGDSIFFVVRMQEMIFQRTYMSAKVINE
jgi:hypothetical protein